MVLYGETQEYMKMPVKTRVTVLCKLSVLNNTVVIKPCLFSSMRCTGTNSTCLDRKTEQVVSDVTHCRLFGTCPVSFSLETLTSVNRVFVVLLSNPRQIPM